MHSFNDPLVEDVKTQKRYRADHLIKNWLESQENAQKAVPSIVIEDLTIEEMGAFIEKHAITSPDGNPVTAPKVFNLLFETAIGTVAGEKAKVYLRGETAQGIFSNFTNILDSTRVQLPFGVGQIGKSFRNEITTGQFVFRTLEFEQAEIEYFFNPEQTEWEPLFEQWQNAMWSFVTKSLGLSEEHLRWRNHTPKELSFYSKMTQDLEYNFSFGWSEMWGIAYRTDYDLTQHMKHSGQDMSYRDPQSGKVFVPRVIEPAAGIARFFLATLSNAYWEDVENNRTVLKLPKRLAPYTVAVFPLLKNKPELVEIAQQVYSSLQKQYPTAWDSRGNISKRYLYQDDIGTPYCVTVDFDTLTDNCITVRDRDTTKEKRVSLDKLEAYLRSMVE